MADTANTQTADGWVQRIRSLRQELGSGRLYYDGNTPDFVSNVAVHSGDTPRLRRYASGVISARIMQLYAATRMKTFSFTDLFLSGIERNIVYGLPFAARAQIEVLIVVWDVSQVLTKNQGTDEKAFAERVEVVDRALIKAVYGARNDFLPKLLKYYGAGMPEREILTGDVEALQATNILTRMKKMCEDSRYAHLADSYEILCELAHPNMLQNFLLTTYDEKRPKILRWAYDSEALKKALALTAKPMALASEATMELIDTLQPPFGIGTIVPADLP